MAKKSPKWNERKKQEFILSGRGQGTGKDYKPWITIQDFSSQGRASRVYGWKTKRIHHLLTDLQTKYFYLLEWTDSVIDIREQYPLLDFDAVVKDKEDLNLTLFCDKESHIPYVISTTFLVTCRNKSGDIRYAARSLKVSSELEKKTSLEKLEIERRYWQEKGINWGVVTQKEIPNALSRNIEWIHSSLLDFENRGFTHVEMQFMCNALIDKIEKNIKVMREIICEYDEEFNFEAGTGLFIFKYLIATKQLKVDMNKKIDINKLISADILITYGEGERLNATS